MRGIWRRDPEQVHHEHMGRYPVRPDTEAALLVRMAALGIREEDLEERFIRGSGSGGQKINKTSSCVALRHIPSNIEVRCQRERSQSANRFFARRELCDRIEEAQTGVVRAEQAAVAKIRRQKARRSRRTRQKIRETKEQRSALKRSRRTPDS